MAQKKITFLSLAERKTLINKGDKEMSVRKQCELLNISRSGVYYKRKEESAYNIELMHMIDKEYTDHPNMGVRSMTAFLRNNGKKCGPKRVRRLMRLMCLESVYPKPRTTIGGKEQKKIPLFAKGCGNNAAKSGMEYRYNLYKAYAWLCLFNSDNGFIQPQSIKLEVE